MAALDFTKPLMTRDGLKAEVIKTDVKSEWPVIAVITRKDGSQFSQNLSAEGLVGRVSSSIYTHPCDLIQYDPWLDVPVDAKILVRNSIHGVIEKRHFARLSSIGVVAFDAGFSSWTSRETQTSCWKYAYYPELDLKFGSENSWS